MTCNVDLACALQESVGELWMEGFLTDFTVVVDSREFQCHRLILSACSDFFKVHMRSQMKESVENSFNLEGMSKDTFETILNYFYRGLDGLTTGNMIELWRAVHQLQIKYLIQKCKCFILENISKDNVIEICQHARLLGCTEVSSATHQLMLEQFDERNMDDFLDLPFEDIHMLIQSHDLNVSSEDNVVEFILKWISHVPHNGDLTNDNIESNGETEDSGLIDRQIETNDGSDVEFNQNRTENDGAKNTKCQERDLRQKSIASLLKAARLCLVSYKLLKKLLKNPLVTCSTEALNVVHESLFYQVEIELREGQWPTSAIHRVSSDMEHVMIFIDNAYTVVAYSLKGNEFHAVHYLPTDLYCSTSITVHDNILYVEGSKDGKEKYKFRRLSLNEQSFPDSLVSPFPCKGKVSQFLADGNSIIRCHTHKDASSLFEYRVNTTDWLDKYPRFKFDVTYMAKFQNLILLFTKGNVATQTLVHCVDTKTKQETSKVPIDGPPDNIISFTDNHDVYIIQRNGVLRKILSTSSGSVDFQYVCQLWDFDWKIHGAVSFRNQLFVFGTKDVNVPEGKSRQKSVPGVFPDVQYVEVLSKTMCLPMVILGSSISFAPICVYGSSAPLSAFS